MKTYETITKKTCDSQGFSLTEMLVTVLIMGLVSTIMATGIPVAAGSYRKVINSSNAQLALSSTLSVMRREIGVSTDVRVANDASIDGSSLSIFYLSDEGYWASISNSVTGSGYRGLVKRYFTKSPDSADQANSGINDTFLGSVLVDDDGDAQIYPLVTNESMNDTRDPLSVLLTVEAGIPSKTFTVKGVSVSDGSGTVLAEVSDYSILLRFK